MCSISGFTSQYPIDKQTALRLSSALLFFGAIRGNQSSGIYINGKVHKKAIEPLKFIETREFLALFEKKTDLVLCHTRMPTCGGTGDEQAQPFQQSTTVTVHNGYYHNIPEIKEKWGIVKNSGVDSELVTSFINSYGIRELPKFLESTSGPSAIATLYKRELYIARHENPCVYTRLNLSGNHILIFASTSDILESALNHVWLGKWKVEQVKDNRLFQVTPKRLKEIAKMKAEKYAIFDYKWNDYEYDTYDMINENWSNKKGSKRDRLRKIAGYDYHDLVETMSDKEVEESLKDYE